MRLKKTKALRYVVATFLTIGTVLSVGFLSFSGLWIIYPYVTPAILAFLLSGVIEGKVFGTSIFKGLARLKLLTSNAEKHLLFSELNKFLEKDSFQTCKCNFLSDYCNQRKRYKALKNDPKVKEEDIQEAKKRLEELKDYFYQQISEPNADNDAASYINPALKEASVNELKSAKRSIWFLRFFWVISILTGVVSGFVTAFAVQEAITVGLALSLSTAALSAIVWPVAIFAAIGATFLLYYAITDIVKNDAIEKAFSKTFQLFKKNNHESLIFYLFRLLALSIVVVGIMGLTLFATAASAGTCWIAMRKGIVLLAPKLPVFVAYCTSAILIPLSFATDLIYGFSTTLQTIDNCKSIFQAIFEGVKHPIKGIKNFGSNIEAKLDKVKQKESWGQFFNPFRILAKLVISPLQSLVFIGHLISIGLTTDRFMNIPPQSVAVGCAVSEALQDLSFFTKEDGHDHGNLLQLPLQVLFSPALLTVGVLYWAIKKCGNEVSFFDAIKQTFELPLLNIVFFPLLLLSAIWHWTFKKETNNLTFFESIKQNFEVHTHEHTHEHEHEHEHEKESTSVELSQEWKTRRVALELAKADKHLDGAWVGLNIAIKKKHIIKLIASNIKEIINYFKETQQENSDITFEEAVDMYFNVRSSTGNSENRTVTCLNGSVKEQAIQSKEFIPNGYRNKDNQLSYFQILQTRRGFFSFYNNKKTTMTETYVKDAFSLAIAD